MSKISVTTIAGLTSGGDANTVKIESGDDLVVSTDKLFVDASTDLIGIGTTSPATATGGGIDIHRNGGSSVRIDDTTNSVTGELQVYSAGLNLATVTNHNLILSTNNSAKMTINGSGHVTMSSQPYVTFQGGSGANTSITHGEYFGNTTQGNPAFSTSGSNLARIQGITYNSSNGLFTVPTGGLYLINFQGYYNGSASVVRVDIICNGVQMALGHIGSTVGTVNTSFAATLAANDNVGFRQISGGSGTVQDWYMGPAHMVGYIVKVA